MSILRIFTFIGVVLFCMAIQAANDREHLIQNNGKSCIELKDHDGWSVGVFRPGDYCVSQNLYQSIPLFRLPDQHFPVGSLLSINSSNVTINLMEHHLSAKIGSGDGISSFGEFFEGNFREYCFFLRLAVFKILMLFGSLLFTIFSS